MVKVLGYDILGLRSKFYSLGFRIKIYFLNFKALNLNFNV